MIADIFLSARTCAEESGGRRLPSPDSTNCLANDGLFTHFEPLTVRGTPLFPARSSHGARNTRLTSATVMPSYSSFVGVVAVSVQAPRDRSTVHFYRLSGRALRASERPVKRRVSQSLCPRTCVEESGGRTPLFPLLRRPWNPVLIIPPRRCSLLACGGVHACIYASMP